MEDCVFCKIVKGEIPADIVYRNNNVLAFRDTHPKAPVHILIVPKKHIPSVNEIVESDQAVLGEMLLAAKEIAKNESVADSGYRLGINTGKDAGQEVFHLHMHLIAGKQLILG